MAAKAKKAAVEQSTDAAEKSKALNTAISQIEKKFGAGTIMRLGDSSNMVVSAVSTGSLTLDMALGVVFQEAGSSKFSGRNLPEKRRSHCTLWQRFRSRGAWPLLWTPSTLWTLSMQRRWG